jgi:predicted outer membrane repeat protein
VVEYAKSGGVAVYGFSLVMEECEVQEVSGADAVSFDDGAAGLIVGGSLRDISCSGSQLRLRDLQPPGGGTGVSVSGSGSEIHVTDCTLSIFITGLSISCADRATITNSRFLNNRYGIGCIWTDEVLLNGCLFKNNSGDGVDVRGGDLVACDCTFAANGTGIDVYASSIQLENCVSYDNSSHGASIGSCTGTIDACTFARNDGGGISISSRPIQISDSAFLDNAASKGAGVYLDRSDAELIDRLVAGNAASSGTGGGVYVTGSDPSFCHLTITDNTAKSGGGAIYLTGSSTLELRNSICWNNRANSGNGEIGPSGGSSAALSCADIAGGWPGTGNLHANPEFINVARGFFGLGPESPSIDAGISAVCSSLDADGTLPDLGKRDLYYRQVDHVTVAVHGEGEPVVIARIVGTLSYGAWLSNPTDSLQVVDAWTRWSRSPSSATTTLLQSLWYESGGRTARRCGLRPGIGSGQCAGRRIPRHRLRG